MSIGYTSRITALNKAANGRMLGVKLGRLCIKHNITVYWLALEFHVSRQTIYNWFIGWSDPKEGSREDIKKFIAELKTL